MRVSYSSREMACERKQLLTARSRSDLSELQLRARLRQLRLGPLELGLVGARVDHEQHLTLFDFAALGEIDR